MLTPLPASAINPLDLAQMRVVAVDDNASTRRLVHTILLGGGVGRVHTFADGYQALGVLAEINPDILFLDWQMPGLDGLALTRIIRAAAIKPDPRIPNPQAPIIMLTGQRRECDVETARMAGVTEFVAKPFAPAALMRRIKAVMTRSREFVVSDGYVGPDRRRRASPTYGGPPRRTSDRMALGLREEMLATILSELDDIRKQATDRGAIDGEMAQMCYRSMRVAADRARAIREMALEQASNSLVHYVDAVGGPTSADPKVIDVHLDAMSKLLALGDNSKAAAVLNERLRKAVAKKLPDQA